MKVGRAAGLWLVITLLVAGCGGDDGGPTGPDDDQTAAWSLRLVDAPEAMEPGHEVTVEFDLDGATRPP